MGIFFNPHNELLIRKYVLVESPVHSAEDPGLKHVVSSRQTSFSLLFFSKIVA